MRAALSGHRERAVDEAMGEAPGDPSARLYVEELKLTNFRNYERAGVRLDERPVVLVGDNGAGKTNLLEAVSLLGPGQGLRGRDYGELARKDGPGGWAVAATVKPRKTRPAPALVVRHQHSASAQPVVTIARLS